MKTTPSLSQAAKPDGYDDDDDDDGDHDDDSTVTASSLKITNLGRLYW